MRSLTDIQMELRTLEKELHSALGTLAELHQDIELLKPQPKLSTHMDMKKLYSGIDAVAKKNPIDHPNLGENGPAESREYLKLLAIMIPVESEDFVQPLTYLARIARGCKHSISAEELHRVSVELDLERLEQTISAISSDLYLPLMLDGIMMASVAGAPSSDNLVLLGELGNLLNISEADMTVVAQLAEVLLKNDGNAFLKLNPQKHYPMLGYSVPVEWLNDALERCSHESPHFVLIFNGGIKRERNETHRDGDFVQKGEKLGTVSRDLKSYNEHKDHIYAPKTGIYRSGYSAHTHSLQDAYDKKYKSESPEYGVVFTKDFIVNYFDPR